MERLEFGPPPVVAIPDQLEQPWMMDGNCRGKNPAIFILEKGQSANPARGICAGCLVTDICLDYAMTNHLDGVYGSTTTRQRKRMRHAQI